MNINDFNARMAKKLELNSHKGSWLEIPAESLLASLMGEVGELQAALSDRRDEEHIIDECGDVANFAYMIATIAGDHVEASQGAGELLRCVECDFTSRSPKPFIRTMKTHPNGHVETIRYCMECVSKKLCRIRDRHYGKNNK